MRRLSWRTTLAGACALLIGTAGLLSALPFFANHRGEEFVATVGGEGITKVEFAYFLKTVANQMESQAKALDDEAKRRFWQSDIDGGKASDVAKERALLEAQRFKIQLLKAAEHGLSLDDAAKARIAAQIEGLKETLLGEEAADRRMTELYGVNLRDYKSIVEKLAVATQAARLEGDRIAYTDEDLRAYYEEHKEAFDTVSYDRAYFPKYEGRNREPVAPELLAAFEKDAKTVAAEAGMELNRSFSDIAAAHESMAGRLVDGGVLDMTFGEARMSAGLADWVLQAPAGAVKVFDGEESDNIEIIRKRGVSETFEAAKDRVTVIYLDTRYPTIVEQWTAEERFRTIMNEDVYEAISVGA